MTYVKPDLISSIDMCKIIKKCMIGGVGYIGQRCSKANNNHMKSYDKDKTSKSIVVEDANNLYEWVMSLYPPVGRF